MIGQATLRLIFQSKDYSLPSLAFCCCPFWWLVELPMWLTDGFLDTFFGRWRGAVRIHMSHMQLTCGINVHSNYYYMVEGSPHVWLTCGD